MENNNEIPRKELMSALLNITKEVEKYNCEFIDEMSDHEKYKMSFSTIVRIDNILSKTLITG